MHAELVARTEWLGSRVPWESDGSGGAAVAEFSGRACYQSWSKPNPATSHHADYIRHIIEVGHFSVLEHPTATLYFTGISRSLTHELIRHRHFSYSQLSQRYVPSGDVEHLMPPALDVDEFMKSNLYTDLLEHQNESLSLYTRLASWVAERQGVPLGASPEARRDALKAARQTARMVLANAVETRVVVTGNWRAWRHFIAMRATLAADEEICQLAVLCLQILAADPSVAPGFADFVISEHLTRDGRHRFTAASNHEDPLYG